MVAVAIGWNAVHARVVNAAVFVLKVIENFFNKVANPKKLSTAYYYDVIILCIIIGNIYVIIIYIIIIIIA